MQVFGDPIGKTIYLKGAEAHKLHEAFTVAADSEVHNGQPVKLNADGELEPAEADEVHENIIGYSIHNGKEGDIVTVAVRAYATLYVMSAAAVSAGPVAYKGQNTTDTTYMSVGTSAEGTAFGWAIDKATAANQIIRVMVY